MNKNRLQVLAHIAEIAAAIGVMISVIYLAIQIDDSNKELKSQTYNAALANIHEPLMLIVESEEFADIVRIGNGEPGSLDDGQWFRYARYQLLRFDGYEYTFYLNRDNATTPELWLGMDSSFSADIETSPGIRKFWSEYRHAFAEPFQGYVDAKVKQADLHQN